MKKRILIFLCACLLFMVTAQAETFAPGFSAQTIDTNVTYKSWWSPHGGEYSFADGGVTMDWTKDVNASALIAPKAITLGDYTMTTDIKVTNNGVFCVVGTRLSFAAANYLREPRDSSDNGLPGNTWQGNCVGGVYLKLFSGGRMGVYVSDGIAGGNYFYHEIKNDALSFAERKTLKLDDRGNRITVYVNGNAIFTLCLEDLYGTNYREGRILSAGGEELAAFSGVKIPTTGYLGFTVRGGAMQLWNTQIDGDPFTMRPTPMMGWSSWNAFGAEINETKIKETADAMASGGLLAAGYEYVNVDDGYQSRTRDANGNVGYNDLFASGMKSLGDHIHNRGLMYGIYTANGIGTCLSYPGLQYNEERDTAVYASYGVDFIKVDYCLREDLSYSTAEVIYGISVNGTNYPATAENCRGGAVFDGTGIGMIEQNIGHVAFDVNVPSAGKYAVTVNYKQTVNDKLPLFIRINNNPNYRIYYLAKGSTSITVNLPLAAGKNELTFGNPIRPSNQNYDGTSLSYGFISDCLDEAAMEYAAQNGQIARQIKMEVCEWGAHAPWLWAPEFATQWRVGNDINASWDSVNNCYNHCMNFYTYARVGAFNDPDILEVGNIPGITLAQERTHFSLWCMMNAPLLLGNDLRTMSAEILEIVTNEDAIAINQDARAIPCMRYMQSEGVDYLAKPLTEGRLAIAVYNTKSEAATGTISLRRMAEKARSINAPFYEKHFDLKEADIYYAYEVWSKKSVALKDTIFFTCEPYGTCIYIIDTKPTSVEKAVHVEFESRYIMEINTEKTFSFGFFNASDDIVAVSGSISAGEGFSVKDSEFSCTVKTFETVELPFTIAAAAKQGTITATYTVRYADGTVETNSISAAIYAQAKAPRGALVAGDYIYATGGYNAYHNNLSFDGNPLTVGGTVYNTGIGVHAGSDMVYYLGGESHLFKASVGLDDEQAQDNNIVFEVWGDDVLLYRTPAITKGIVEEIVVLVMDKELLHLVVTCGPDGNDAYDHADWLNPRLEAIPMPSEGKLTLAEAVVSREGYGKSKQNASIDGAPLTVAGVVYADGIGTHAAGEIAYYIGGRHAIFTAGVGVDDEALQDYANVDVQVYGDNTLLWETKNLCRGEKKDICLEVEGYQLLRLVTGDYNGLNTHDHVDWLEPQLHTYRPVLARFTNANGVRAETLQDAVNVILNTMDADVDGMLFAVGYKEDRLLYAKKLTANAPLPSMDVDCVKVLLWQKGTLVPLGEASVLE